MVYWYSISYMYYKLYTLKTRHKLHLLYILLLLLILLFLHQYELRSRYIYQLFHPLPDSIKPYIYNTPHTYATNINNKQSAVIYYLIQSTRVNKLYKSLISLHTYFNCHYGYPIILFMTGTDSEFEHRLQQWIHSTLYTTKCMISAQSHPYNITIHHIQFAYPPGINISNVPAYDICSGHGIDYRHMCRFNAILLHNQPVLQQYIYYWRLDDDSKLLEPVMYDPFQYMSYNNITYGFNVIQHDDIGCVIGLYQFTLNYIQSYSQQLHPYNFFHQWSFNTTHHIFYNNFELSTISFWQQSNVAQYLQLIDESYEIYYSRWGDAPIKTQVLSMFTQPSDIHYFNDIIVVHHSSVTGAIDAENIWNKINKHDTTSIDMNRIQLSGV